MFFPPPGPRVGGSRSSGLGFPPTSDAAAGLVLIPNIHVLRQKSAPPPQWLQTIRRFRRSGGKTARLLEINEQHVSARSEEEPSDRKEDDAQRKQKLQFRCGESEFFLARCDLFTLHKWLPCAGFNDIVTLRVFCGSSSPCVR